MKRLRILWVGYHRVARYEEVNSLLRAGAEVVPVSGGYDALPNAQDPPESEDPLYPRWRDTCTIPRHIVEGIRDSFYASDPPGFSVSLQADINRWFDVIVVLSFTRVVADILEWFQGHVILRAYGNYPYSGTLAPGTISGEDALFRLSACDRYLFCPAMPYLGLHEDPRVTRNEHYVQAGVSPERLSERWRGRQSAPVACEVISLIGTYRQQIYADFARAMGDLPLQVFGINPPGGPTGADQRIVGTLADEPYYRALASCRVLPYIGLNTRLHLHYHAIEAMLMEIPVLYLNDGAIAHVLRHHDVDDAILKTAGMCSGVDDMKERAARMIEDVAEATALSASQSAIRDVFGRSGMDQQIEALVSKLRYRTWYAREYGRATADVRPSQSIRLVGVSFAKRVARRITAGVRTIVRPIATLIKRAMKRASESRT